jgi:hypothetical protein
MSDDVFAKAVEAMTDVQRRSAEAAGALIERLVSSVDGDSASVDTHDDADPPRAPSGTDDAIAGMTKLWRESITSLAGALSGNANDTSGARLDVSGGAPPAALRVVLDPATLTGATEVWLHNPSADAFDKLRVHCGAPHAHDGSSIDADALVVEPDAFDLPPRSSRGVQISVDAAGVRAGIYRTLLLVDGLPDQWLPIEIDVPDPAA